MSTELEPLYFLQYGSWRWGIYSVRTKRYQRKAVQNSDRTGMKILDPEKEPNKWLCSVLMDLVEQNTEDSRNALKEAIPVLSQWIEPGLIDSLFDCWIKEYKELMVQSKTS